MTGRLDIAKEQVERAFGPKVAKRLGAFDDGTLYVSASGWAEFAAWIVDFAVYLLCAGIGFVVFAVATRDSAVSGNASLLTLLGLLIGVPVLYGLFFGDGRVLGAALTGTRLVRIRDGGRIGAAACWAMFVRTVLFPLLLVAMVLAGSGGVGSVRRVSIDDEATRRVRERYGVSHSGASTKCTSYRS
ncbi:hypothetical protein [Amycolatopsis sp. EV170708-02-1]|uniref:hypothetical protein n=1 Tax=Amycolatopsis sp. EV170708-02-1 TaxID=2919322 RepID=UPI001F0C7428|nr:hypothetical protein [Amycolatopsis sp. EV170708-02-1]UMO99816.1 hypothetical protein MJQ72_25215 [Amycolatopsis sp. EV170708-02-1]